MRSNANLQTTITKHILATPKNANLGNEDAKARSFKLESEPAIEIAKRKYACDVCRQCFTKSQSLSNHKKTHNKTVASSSNSISNYARAAPTVDELAASYAVSRSINFDDLSADDLVETAESTLRQAKASTSPPRNIQKRPRKAYTVPFKLRVIEKVEMVKADGHAAPINHAAALFNVAQPNVSKWVRDKDNIRAALLEAKKGRKLGKFKSKSRLLLVAYAPWPHMEETLAADIRKRIEKGLSVTGDFIRIHAKQLIRTSYGDAEAEKFKGSCHWLFNFTRRQSFRWRVVTNVKDAGVVERLPKVIKWIENLKKRLSRGAPHRSGEYGRFLLHERYNFDQVPLELGADTRRTYADKGAKRVRVFSKNEKRRIATLMLVARADGSLDGIRWTIIFRGKGNVYEREKISYDTDVRIMFQKKAWMDDELCVEWAKEELDAMSLPQKSLWFADNLSGHCTDAFKSQMREHGALMHYFPANFTDILQPIDDGIGIYVKNRIRNAFEAWKEVEEGGKHNYIRLADGDVSLSEMRILISKWTGTIFRECKRSQSFKDLVCKSFRHTGCALRVDDVLPDGFLNNTNVAREILQPYFESIKSFKDETISESQTEVDAANNENNAYSDENDNNSTYIRLFISNNNDVYEVGNDVEVEADESEVATDSEDDADEIRYKPRPPPGSCGAFVPPGFVALQQLPVDWRSQCLSPSIMLLKKVGGRRKANDWHLYRITRKQSNTDSFYLLPMTISMSTRALVNVSDKEQLEMLRSSDYGAENDWVLIKRE